MVSKALFYPAWVSKNRKGPSLSWGRPCDSPAEAAGQIKQRVMDGDASLGFVICFDADGKTALLSYTQPPSARKIVEHYEQLLEALEKK